MLILIEKYKGPCEELDCKNGGTCSNSLYYKIECLCANGFNGEICENDQRPGKLLICIYLF